MGAYILNHVAHYTPASVDCKADYVTHVAHAGGAARLADQWLLLFRALVRWLQPLDDIERLAQVVHDPSSPLESVAEHPAEGFMANSEVKVIMALLANRAGAVPDLVSVHGHLTAELTATTDLSPAAARDTPPRPGIA